MKTETTLILDKDTQAMLDCLRQTAAETLERKRRLGHYAIIWQDNAPVAIGDDAPEELKPKHGAVSTTGMG